MADVKYRCVNSQFDRDSKLIFNSLDEFLDYCRTKHNVIPECWIRGRGIHTKLPGDRRPDAWTLTLIQLGAPSLWEQQ